MGRTTVKVTGTDKLQAQLDALSEQARQRIAEAVSEAAENVQREARRNAPRDTGRLQNSITTDVASDGLSAEVGPVGNDVAYAIWIEWGRKNAAAQPFMTPASEMERARFVKRIRGALVTVTKSAGR